jgi:hypothetical protein
MGLLTRVLWAQKLGIAKGIFFEGNRQNRRNLKSISSFMGILFSKKGTPKKEKI